MTKPFSEWTVLPHGKLQRLDDNLLCVTGSMESPLGEVGRRMTVARLRDGRLVVYSAVALDEAEMKALESFGELSYLIVPSAIHRLDAKPWKDRYPSMQVIAPAGAFDEVSEVVPVDASSVDFNDPSVAFVSVPGTADQEGALIIQGALGSTLVLNDLIFNLANRDGLKGWLLKTIGMTGTEPRVPAPIKWRLIADKEALARQLEQWSHLPNLQRVIVSHGKIILGKDAGWVLTRISHDLAA